MRTKNRHELTYNCIRLYLDQAGHRLIFQALPLIEDVEDFAILFDFDTQSRWKRSPFKDLPLHEAQIEIVRPVPVSFRAVPVETDSKIKAAYARERERLFAEAEDSDKDPHTLPRNLYLVGGKAKVAHVEPGRPYLGRNNRLGIPALRTYREDAYPEKDYAIFELPHNHIDLADVVTLTGQGAYDVLVADLKVDAWYFDRFTSWAQRIADAYAALQR